MAGYIPWRTNKATYRSAVVHLALRIRAVTDVNVHPEVMLAAVEHVLHGLAHDGGRRIELMVHAGSGRANPVLVALEDVVAELLGDPDQNQDDCR